MSVLRFYTSLQKITESSLDRPKPSQKSCGLRSGPFEDHLLNIHDDRGKQDCIGVICFHWSPTFGNTWSWYTFTLIFTLLSMKIRKQFTVVVIPVKTVNPFGKKAFVWRFFVFASVSALHFSVADEDFLIR